LALKSRARSLTHSPLTAVIECHHWISIGFWAHAPCVKASASAASARALVFMGTPCCGSGLVVGRPSCVGVVTRVFMSWSDLRGNGDNPPDTGSPQALPHRGKTPGLVPLPLKC